MHNGNLRPRIISLTILCVVRFCQMIAEKEIFISKLNLNLTQIDRIYLKRGFTIYPSEIENSRKNGGGGVNSLIRPIDLKTKFTHH